MVGFVLVAGLGTKGVSVLVLLTKHNLHVLLLYGDGCILPVSSARGRHSFVDQQSLFVLPTGCRLPHSVQHLKMV